MKTRRPLESPHLVRKVPRVRLFDVNWQQVDAYLDHDDRVVLPIGSTEQHGFLSLGTDAILAERVALEAIPRCCSPQCRGWWRTYRRRRPVPPSRPPSSTASRTRTSRPFAAHAIEGEGTGCRFRQRRRCRRRPVGTCRTSRRRTAADHKRGKCCEDLHFVRHGRHHRRRRLEPVPGR